MVAARKNDDRTVIKLLANQGEFKSNPNIQDLDGWSPLHWGSRWKNEATVKALLEAKADPDPITNFGQTPLHFSSDLGIVSGSLKIASMLVRMGADPNLRDNFHQTPYEISAIHGNEPVAKLLLSKKANPESFRRRISPSAATFKGVRVMNRAKAKLKISCKHCISHTYSTCMHALVFCLPKQSSQL